MTTTFDYSGQNLEQEGNYFAKLDNGIFSPKNFKIWQLGTSLRIFYKGIILLERMTKMQEVPLNDGDSYTLYFGKYKGMNVVEVYEQDPSYIEWVYDNMELSEGLKSIVENLVTTGCPF